MLSALSDYDWTCLKRRFYGVSFTSNKGSLWLYSPSFLIGKIFDFSFSAFSRVPLFLNPLLALTAGVAPVFYLNNSSLVSKLKIGFATFLLSSKKVFFSKFSYVMLFGLVFLSKFKKKSIDRFPEF